MGTGARGFRRRQRSQTTFIDDLENASHRASKARSSYQAVKFVPRSSSFQNKSHNVVPSLISRVQEARYLIKGFCPGVLLDSELADS